MSLVLFLARTSRATLLSALSASVLSGLGVATLIALINASLTADSAALARLGLGFAATSVAMLGFRWYALRQFVELGQVTLARLRMHVSRHLLQAPFRALESHGDARLLSVLTEDIARVGESIVMVPRLVVHGVVLIGCLSYLAVLSGKVFLAGLVLMLLGSLGYYQRARRADGHLRTARAHEDALYRGFRSLFFGAKELKLHRARRETFVASLHASVDDVRRERTAGLLIHVAAVSARMFLLFAAIGAVLFVLGTVIAIDGQVRSGYALMLLYMMLPLHALLEALPVLGRTRVALEQIHALGVGAPEDTAAPARAPLSQRAPFRELALEDVTHTYRRDDEDGTFTFGPVSLTLRPSEVVFVVGGNGSGKTTLAKLLVGLYEPESGRVRHDGEVVSDERSRTAYRQIFAAVFSDFHLFERLLGDEAERLDERAHDLLQALDLGHKVSIRDGAFSTTELSSGQRKRLALLVACLEDRPVYVFDEWTADQDPAYKEVFYSKVLPELKARGKAVVVITHDDRYFHLADRRLKLEFGKLVPETVPAASTGRDAFRLPSAPATGSAQLGGSQ